MPYINHLEFFPTSLSRYCLTDEKLSWKTIPRAAELLLKDLVPEDACQNVSLDTIFNSKFPINFPINNMKCKTLKKHVDSSSLEMYVNSAYPVIHEKALKTIAIYLANKANKGKATDKEREVYKEMSVLQFINRLLLKRAVSFIGPEDKYLLINSKSGQGGWDHIESNLDDSELTLKDCLSYTEMKLSAFLSVSSYTHFLNLGGRENQGVYLADRTYVENEGVIVGVIGPRLEKPFFMEYQELLRTNKDKALKNYPPELFMNCLYDEQSFTFEEIEAGIHPGWFNRYRKLPDNVYFDDVVYSKRIALSFDTFIIEANERAKQRKLSAYVYVAGFGLGHWHLSKHQYDVFQLTCCERIRVFGRRLSNVADVDFGFMKRTMALPCKSNQFIEITGHPQEGIMIHFTETEPYLKISKRLDSHIEGRLLVVPYDWNSNALPGNDFWAKSTGSRGSAAAYSTQIAELHNPHINPKVNASNLRVVTVNGLVPFGDYQKAVSQIFANTSGACRRIEFDNSGEPVASTSRAR